MNDDLLTLTAEIVSAHAAKNAVASEDLAPLIASVHATLANLAAPAEAEAPARPEGAVTARKSLSDPAKIISMIDGKPYSTLKRHITRHGYTPESYREAFGLPASYPMVAEAYRAVRSELSKKFGLGRKRVGEVVQTVEDAGEAIVEVAKDAGKRVSAVAAKAAAAAHLSGEPAPQPAKRGRPAKAKNAEAPDAADAPKRTGWWSKPDQD